MFPAESLVLHAIRFPQQWPHIDDGTLGTSNPQDPYVDKWTFTPLWAIHVPLSSKFLYSHGCTPQLFFGDGGGVQMSPENGYDDRFEATSQDRKHSCYIITIRRNIWNCFTFFIAKTAVWLVQYSYATSLRRRRRHSLDLPKSSPVYAGGRSSQFHPSQSLPLKYKCKHQGNCPLKPPNWCQGLQVAYSKLSRWLFLIMVRIVVRHAVGCCRDIFISLGVSPHIMPPCFCSNEPAKRYTSEAREYRKGGAAKSWPRKYISSLSSSRLQSYPSFHFSVTV